MEVIYQNLEGLSGNDHERWTRGSTVAQAGHSHSFIVVRNANSYPCGLETRSSKVVTAEGLLAGNINICRQDSGSRPVSSHIED